MKKKTYQFLVVTLSLLMMLAASCGRENDFADPSPMTASASAAASTSDGIADEPVAEPTESNGATLTLHGLVCRAGEILLVHPEPWRVLDPADVDPADCLEIPLAGVSLTEAMPPLPIEDIAEIRVGDFVQVRYSEKMESANRPKKVYSVARCGNVVKEMKVEEIREDRLVIGNTFLNRAYFDRGQVLDAAGNPVAFEDVSLGDLFEVRYDGWIKASSPGHFDDLHVVRLLKTAEQIKIEEAEQAARDAVEALNKKVVLRGTVRDFGTFRNLVYLGETVAPEEVGFHGCTILGGREAFPITDAATGQALTWEDLQDGDYVAVECINVIATTAPGQMHTVYSVTRLSRLCLEGTVTAMTPNGVIVACEDGKSRTVSLNQYYVRTVQFDIESLRVGDKVRLDLNALDETEVYALHLIDRNAVIPEGAVTETLLVIQPGNMREIWTVRDLDYDTTQLHWDEKTGVRLFDGDAVFSVKNIFHDTDGTLRPVRQLQPGDLITITYSGQLTESEHPCFAEIYQITRVAE